MSGKYMKVRKVVIPLISLVILLSQGMGVVAISGDEITGGQGIEEEVVIEYSEMNESTEQVTYLSAQQARQAQTYTATPSADNTTLNGSPVTMQAYKINGNNYVKLRDFANMVNGTPQNFEVVWDGSLNAINMYTQKPYTAVGGEGTPIGTEEKQAKDTTSSIYVNSQQVSLKGYNINNNNYFKLRDLGSALGIGIDWDNTTKTVVVDSIGATGQTGEQGNTETPETGSTEIDKPTTIDGKYVLTPEQEEYLQISLASLGSPKMAERIEAGWRTTLDPSDPNHPGWNKDGSFALATLKPGQMAPEGVMYDVGGCIQHGEAAVASWEGVVVNGG